VDFRLYCPLLSHFESLSAALKFFWTCIALKLVDDDDDDDDDTCAIIETRACHRARPMPDGVSSLSDTAAAAAAALYPIGTHRRPVLYILSTGLALTRLMARSP